MTVNRSDGMEDGETSARSANADALGGARWTAEVLIKKASQTIEAAVEQYDIPALSEAVACGEEAMAACSKTPTLRCDALNILGQAYHAMFEQTRETEYLVKTVAAHEEAVHLCSPTLECRPRLLCNLATALHTRFTTTADIRDLDQSITLCEQAFQICPPSAADRSLCLSVLACTLHSRFKATADPTDLDQSIAFAEEALSQASSACRPLRLHSLAEFLLTRFVHKAANPDLERGISLLEQGLLLCKSDYARHLCLSELAFAIMTRFERTRDAADLEISLSLQRQVLELCPPTHILRSLELSNFGVLLHLRFALGGDIANLNRAIDVLREALEVCPPNHVDRLYRLSNLAVYLSDRLYMTSSVDDLDESTTLLEEALRLCPATHWARYRLLADLAYSLSSRYKLVHSISDLDRSIELTQSAADSLLPEHPWRTYALHRLCVAQLDHIIGTIEDSNHICGYSGLSIDIVIDQLREAVNAHHSPSDDRLDASLLWVDASTVFHPASLLEAYYAMYDALDTAITRGHSLESRYSQLTSNHDIKRAKEHITDAVTFAITENLPRDAVIFLERGRTLLLAQIGQCRTPLDVVREKDEDLANRLDAVGRQLDGALSSRTKPDSFAQNSPANDPIAKSMKLTSEWDILVEQARQLDSCEDFLMPVTFEHLREGASGGPVVFISVAEPSSHAIIVLYDSEPVIVPLPNATPLEVWKLTDAFLHARKSPTAPFNLALGGLWDVIVGPVVDQLKALILVRSRIWWCPSAAVAELPLHAAGHYFKGADPKKKLPRLFVSSYTSSLGALIRARRTTSQDLPSEPSLLVISQPNTAGETALNVHSEISYISQKLSTTTILEGQDGTPEAVTTAIPQHSWAHFSCHAYSTTANPLRSYFSLHGNHLDVLDVLRTQTPHAELAVLTACHTADAGTDAPEEFLHLAGAMQFAGFRSVVGTLWEMDDADGAFVISELYRRLFAELEGGNRLAYTCAARALNETVWKLRSEKRVEPWRWVNYVHYGA